MLAGDDVGAVVVDVVASLCVVGVVGVCVEGRLVVGLVFVVSLSEVAAGKKSEDE